MNHELDDVEVRPAAEADAPEIMRLLDQLAEAMTAPTRAARHERAENIRHFLRSTNNRIRLACHQGKVVGVISLNLRRTLLNPTQVGLIDELAVDESVRGQGVGRRLIRKVVEYARDRGLGEVEVNTETTNTAALEFYRRCGFDQQHVLLEMELDG